MHRHGNLWPSESSILWALKAVQKEEFQKCLSNGGVRGTVYLLGPEFVTEQIPLLSTMLTRP